MKLSDIYQAVSATGVFDDHEDLSIYRVCTDSRLVQPGDLFVCLSGQNFDGHDFVAQALQSGAAALLIERPVSNSFGNVPVLQVDSSLKALADLASAFRKRFSGQVIGVTGTAGKTTVKEMMAAFLEHVFMAHVGKSYRNWNNQLGLSLSILSMTGQEDFWILELGVSEIAEMDGLGRIACPDAGVIVNVGPAHLQGLGSERGVAKEKAVLFDYIALNGVAVMSLDYPVLREFVPIRGDLKWQTFSYQQEQAGYFGLEHNRSSSLDSSYSYTLWSKEHKTSFSLPWPGMLENLLAVAATLRGLGIEFTKDHYGLDSLTIPDHRFHIQEIGAFVLIDDCYNANPISMHSALSRLARMSDQGSFVVILGDMKELGHLAPELHYQLGKSLAEFKDIRVLYQGEYFKEVAEGFGSNQVDQTFFEIMDLEHFIYIWRTLGLESGMILFKGSRGCALEEYVQALIKELNQ